MLSGCGLKGDLVRPMPLWGDPPLDGPTDPRVIEKAEAEAKARQEADKAARTAARAKALEDAKKETTPPAASANPATP
jgi:hypothetical protein